MQGLPTIRAYDAGARFYEAFLEYLDTNGAWWFCFIVTSRWIGFRLDAIAAIMLTAGALLAMAIHNKVTSAQYSPLFDHHFPPYIFVPASLKPLCYHAFRVLTPSMVLDEIPTRSNKISTRLASYNHDHEQSRAVLK